jgi:hypothetical protein
VADDAARPAGCRATDLVQRDLTASRPNRLSVADVSYLGCRKCFVYFAIVLDRSSRIMVAAGPRDPARRAHRLAARADEIDGLTPELRG